MIVTLKITYSIGKLGAKLVGFFDIDMEEITKRRENHECNINEAALRGGRTLWTSDKTLESKDGRVHLHRKKWYLYY